MKERLNYWITKIRRAPATLRMLTRIEWGQLQSRGLKDYLALSWKDLRNRSSHQYPRAAQIEPHGGCNIRCAMCFQGRMMLPGDHEALSIDAYKQIIDELSPVVPRLYLFWRGEPMLHRQLGEMIAYAKKRNMYVYVSTNAVLLDENKAREFIESGLDFLLVGFDGASKETYEQMRRGAKFEQVSTNIKRLIELRQQYKSWLPHVCLQLIVSSVNIHELAAFRRLSNEMGADSCIEKLLDVYQNFNNEKIRKVVTPLYISGEWSKYKQKDKQFEIARRPPECEMVTRMVIRADLQLSLCCYDMQSQFNIGQAQPGRLLELWHSPQYSKLRDLGRQRKTGLCTNCGEGIQR